MVLLEILQADLKMELSSTGDDVFSVALVVALDHRVGLGQPLESLNQLGEILGVDWLDSDTDDRGDRELHLLHVVGILGGFVGEGSCLDDVLINSDETDGVTGRDGVDVVNVTTHHQDGPEGNISLELGSIKEAIFV